MQINFASIEMPQSGAAVFFVEKDQPFSGLAAEADTLTSGALSKARDVSRFTGASGQSVEVVAPSGMKVDRVVLIGAGEAADLSESKWVELGGSVYAALANSGSKEASVIVEIDSADAVSMAEGALLRSYRFDKYRTKEPESKKPTLAAITFATKDGSEETAFRSREQVASGVFHTRDLISEPANILNPESYAERIKELEALGVEVEVLGEEAMAKLGMHSLLGVGLGSAYESQLVVMRWNGADDKGAQPISFVGKGVTFDTGGISLKPGAGMEQMKWDMGGSGIVVGLMKALAARKAKVNVVASVGLVENMPSGTAQRPGDVVTSMSGQTIEILNTDAEGRLVLADAMWYTQDRYKPKFMIDLATLTGAIITSLGHEHAGLFSNDDELAAQLAKAGADTGDKVWRMPIHENYDKLIDCPTADMKNIGGPAAGSITAAQFLQRFTNDVPWVHLDVAGMVWSDKDLPLSEKGGTGYGVRLLDRFVADNYEG